MGFDMNYKIKVESNVEEIQDLFIQLGCKYFNHTVSDKNYMLIEDGKAFFYKFKKSFDKSKSKEITLPELRDLVVLKRNDVGDATHIRGDGKKYFHARATDFFYQFSNDGEWLLSTWMNYQLLKQLKPIEKKEMKEYLIKINGAYKLCSLLENDVTDEYIEIPKGSVKATLCNDFLIFWKGDYLSLSKKNGDTDFTFDEKEDYGFVEYMDINDDAILIWQRSESPNDKLASAEQYRQAEVLPFIDDEPKSAWDTQVGGDHYKKYKIQPMLFALENNLNPLQHSVLKYIMRHEDKNGKQDLEKAKHYIDLMIAHYYPAE